MRLLLPVLLILCLGAGYLLGVRDKRSAFTATRAVAQHELDRYESQVRAL